MDGLIYLASPYSHADADVREERFHAVCEAAGALMRDGHLVFSPIAHSHPIAIANELPKGFDYWQRWAETMLSRCDCIAVLTIDGWQESVGVAAEIGIARLLNLPVHFIEIEDDQVFISTNGESNGKHISA